MASSRKAWDRHYNPGQSEGWAVLSGCGVVGALIVGAFALAFMPLHTIQNDSASIVSTTTVPLPPKKVTAVELFNDYQVSSAAAQQEYGNQRLEVSGVVAGLDSDFADNPIILLMTSNPLMNARAKVVDSSKPKVPTLRNGQLVVLLCQDVSEVAGAPLLTDCDIL